MEVRYASWTGPITFIGYGSIAQGLLPLLFRHIKFNNEQLHFIEPRKGELDKITIVGAHLHNLSLTKENYQEVLSEIICSSIEQTLIINLSVDVSSVDIMAFAHSVNALYIDTVIEPWLGYYSSNTLPQRELTNYHLREELLNLRLKLPIGATAISCCGANPGMVSWLTKQALLNLANDIGIEAAIPKNRAGWAELMFKLDVKGIHIAERDTQRTYTKKETHQFTNTWSVDGLIAESKQPAELGWGTHELVMPKNAHTHKNGSGCAIYLDTPGGMTKIKSWVPSGPQEAYLITHNEAISLSEYFTAFHENGDLKFRPTCNYAYHPCAETISSLDELFAEEIAPHTEHRVLKAEEIETGSDELGVLLYGHKKNAYWFGSTLSIEATKQLAPNQNATGLQVSSAVLSGIVWMIQNPNQGIVEVEEIDFDFCLQLQRKYLGTLHGVYTDWYPDMPHTNYKGVETTWQFSNIII